MSNTLAVTERFWICLEENCREWHWLSVWENQPMCILSTSHQHILIQNSVCMLLRSLRGKFQTLLQCKSPCRRCGIKLSVSLYCSSCAWVWGLRFSITPHWVIVSVCLSICHSLCLCGSLCRSLSKSLFHSLNRSLKILGNITTGQLDKVWGCMQMRNKQCKTPSLLCITGRHYWWWNWMVTRLSKQMKKEVVTQLSSHVESSV